MVLHEDDVVLVLVQSIYHFSDDDGRFVDRNACEDILDRRTDLACNRITTTTNTKLFRGPETLFFCWTIDDNENDGSVLHDM